MSQSAALEKQNKENTYLNTVIQGDCIEVMKEIPDNSFDIAIADPPYNVSKGGNWEWNSDAKLSGFGGNWKKVMEQWDDKHMGNFVEVRPILFSLAKSINCLALSVRSAM